LIIPGGKKIGPTSVHCVLSSCEASATNVTTYKIQVTPPLSMSAPLQEQLLDASPQQRGRST
jgi:hypothetical protein